MAKMQGTILVCCFLLVADVLSNPVVFKFDKTPNNIRKYLVKDKKVAEPEDAQDTCGYKVCVPGYLVCVTHSQSLS